MTAHINTVLKQALTTFSCKSEVFKSNLNILTALLDKVTAEDVNLNPQFAQDSFWNRPQKAPVSCIDIYEDMNVTLGIFVLKPGGQLPLHNHPEMHGLIKVLMGKIKITSYSLNTEKTCALDSGTNNGDSFKPSKTYKKSIITAELVSTEVVDVNSQPCLLEPSYKNLHKIESVDGPAAFLDILAPPYMTQIPNNGERQCSYYNVLSQAAPNVFRLHEIKSPSWYWCDIHPYTGPSITAI